MYVYVTLPDAEKKLNFVYMIVNVMLILSPLSSVIIAEEFTIYCCCLSPPGGDESFYSTSDSVLSVEVDLQREVVKLNLSFLIMPVTFLNHRTFTVAATGGPFKIFLSGSIKKQKYTFSAKVTIKLDRT